jgi:hypothetical protein
MDIIAYVLGAIGLSALSLVLAISLVSGMVLFAGGIIKCALALARLRSGFRNWTSGQCRRFKDWSTRIREVRHGRSAMA